MPVKCNCTLNLSKRRQPRRLLLRRCLILDSMKERDGEVFVLKLYSGDYADGE